MKLEQQERQENEEVMELIHETHEEGKILDITCESEEKEIKAYGTYLYDTEEKGEVYLLYIPDNFPGREKFCSKEWLHDMILKQDEVEVIETRNVEVEENRKALQRYESYENPKDEVHVIIKTTDDGRYKDDYKYAREGLERDEKWIGGHNPEESRFEYIDLGTFREVVERDESWDYDLKQGGRGVPVDFRAITSEDERQIMKDKIQGKST